MIILPYRGKRIDTNVFIYGNLIWQPKRQKTYIAAYCCFVIINYTEEGSNLVSRIVDSVFEVIPKTVGQQIGFEDKNKKPIYVGDLCKFADWQPKEIIWKDGRYMLGDSLVICCKMECDKMEIIGDVHTDNKTKSK